MMKSKFKSDMDSGFSIDEVEKLIEYKLSPPSDVLKASIEGSLDINEYNTNIGKTLSKLGARKGNLSKGKGKIKNEAKIDELTQDINLIQKYRNRN